MNDNTKCYIRQGRKFVPIGEYRFALPFEPAWYLVAVKDYGQSIYHDVTPERAAVKAAIEEAREAMIKALIKVSEPRPVSHQITERERRAFAAFRKIMGEDMAMLAYESTWGIVDAAVKVLEEKLK